MKVKTLLKVGKTAQAYTYDLDKLMKRLGRQAAPLVKQARQTLTNPKFWTWPF